MIPEFCLPASGSLLYYNINRTFAINRMSGRLKKRGKMTNSGYFLKDLQRSQMKNNTLDKEEIKKNIDDCAFYFLIAVLIIIVTFSVFKWEILYLIFSHLL